MQSLIYCYHVLIKSILHFKKLLLFGLKKYSLRIFGLLRLTAVSPSETLPVDS